MRYKRLNEIITTWDVATQINLPNTIYGVIHYTYQVNAEIYYDKNGYRDLLPDLYRTYDKALRAAMQEDCALIYDYVKNIIWHKNDSGKWEKLQSENLKSFEDYNEWDDNNRYSNDWMSRFFKAPGLQHGREGYDDLLDYPIIIITKTTIN